MTKLIRNLSFAAFLAAASLSPSTELHAQVDCGFLLQNYCLWGPIPPNGVGYACTSPVTCGQMEDCCEQSCEGLDLEVTENSCGPTEAGGNIAGRCVCG